MCGGNVYWQTQTAVGEADKRGEKEEKDNAVRRRSEFERRSEFYHVTHVYI